MALPIFLLLSTTSGHTNPQKQANELPEYSVFPNGVGAEQNKAKKRVTTVLIMWTETQPQMTVNTVSACLRFIYISFIKR